MSIPLSETTPSMKGGSLDTPLLDDHATVNAFISNSASTGSRPPKGKGKRRRLQRDRYAPERLSMNFLTQDTHLAVYHIALRPLRSMMRVLALWQPSSAGSFLHNVYPFFIWTCILFPWAHFVLRADRADRNGVVFTMSHLLFFICFYLARRYFRRTHFADMVCSVFGHETDVYEHFDGPGNTTARKQREQAKLSQFRAVVHQTVVYFSVLMVASCGGYLFFIVSLAGSSEQGGNIVLDVLNAVCTAIGTSTFAFFALYAKLIFEMHLLDIARHVSLYSLPERMREVRGRPAHSVVVGSSGAPRSAPQDVESPWKGPLLRLEPTGGWQHMSPSPQYNYPSPLSSASKDLDAVAENVHEDSVSRTAHDPTSAHSPDIPMKTLRDDEEEERRSSLSLDDGVHQVLGRRHGKKGGGKKTKHRTQSQALYLVYSEPDLEYIDDNMQHFVHDYLRMSHLVGSTSRLVRMFLVLSFFLAFVGGLLSLYILLQEFALSNVPISSRDVAIYLPNLFNLYVAMSVLSTAAKISHKSKNIIRRASELNVLLSHLPTRGGTDALAKKIEMQNRASALVTLITSRPLYISLYGLAVDRSIAFAFFSPLVALTLFLVQRVLLDHE